MTADDRTHYDGDGCPEHPARVHEPTMFCDGGPRCPGYAPASRVLGWACLWTSPPPPPPDVFGDVRDWHRAFGVPVLNRPEIPPEDRIALRFALLDEEAVEFGLAVQANDLAQIAKEGCDLIYVIAGLFAEYGIDGAAVWAEVQRSNMSKLGADGRPVLRADGKVLKGPNYHEADVAKALTLRETP